MMAYLNSKKGKIIAIISVILLVVLPVSVFAYLRLTDGQLTNSFTSAPAVDPIVKETFSPTEENVKSNVSVNVGTPGYDVYVRAAVVITWYNKTEGKTLATLPVEGTDYAITWAGGNWVQGIDGFWYYTLPVGSGENTGTLITSCAPLREAPESGYTLRVQIVAQTIQVAGVTEGNVPAVSDAWGVTKNSNKSLTVPTPTPAPTPTPTPTPTTTP